MQTSRKLVAGAVGGLLGVVVFGVAMTALGHLMFGVVLGLAYQGVLAGSVTRERVHV